MESPTPWPWSNLIIWKSRSKPGVGRPTVASAGGNATEVKRLTEDQLCFAEAKLYASSIMRAALQGIMCGDRDAVRQSALALKASMVFLKATSAICRGVRFQIDEEDIDHMRERMNIWCSQTNCGVQTVRWECN